MLRHLCLFANARRLHRCGELNELTDLADFLLERLSGQLTAHVGVHGLGMSKSLQIFCARNSMISRCRGTEDDFCARRLT
jgi:hypothetical protein